MKPYLKAALISLGVGIAHYTAHTLAGNPATFGEAGVMTAGITSMIVAFFLSWLLIEAK